MKTIVLCASAAFYEHTNQIADQLTASGFNAVVPKSARQMRKNNNYIVEAVKTWYEHPENFYKKANFMREHFDEIAKGDVVLVINDSKHGVPGYIGSNVLLEMGLGFYLNKPIYVLNPVSIEASNYEEVMGMGSIMLNGNLSKISKG